MDSPEQTESTKQKQAPLIGVVLAGGLSRRMGEDKALLPFQDSTLLHHQVELLKPLCDHVLVSGDYAGFACVPDTVARCGPLGGIYSVALNNPGANLLVIAVDMPLLTTQHLRVLMNCPQTCFIEGHPLPAMFRQSESLLVAINGIFEDSAPNFSIRHLHQILNSSALQFAEFNGLNINNPEQWQDFNLSLNKRV
ncbi:MAG TPA: molybdenum cofactor guanylyltransferase [Arenimonas sp.]|nr:molybdenum cofactor guanylyltransferase [Arenimonas sp.]